MRKNKLLKQFGVCLPSVIDMTMIAEETTTKILYLSTGCAFIFLNS